MLASPESLNALKRHFLGALSEPLPLPLGPEPGPRLLLAGGTPWGRRGFFIDFGRVETPGEERQTLRVVNSGPEPLELRAVASTLWMEARWSGGEGDAVLEPSAGAELELIARHDLFADTTLVGAIQLVATAGVEDSILARFAVRLDARRAQPVGRYEFQGQSEPAPFDFGPLAPTAIGAIPHSYSVSIQNQTEIPLIVSCADLPDWLVFAVDGHQRSGPVAGRFFERAAPFQMEIRPQVGAPVSGPRRSRLVLHTNDSRPAWQRIELQLSAGAQAG